MGLIELYAIFSSILVIVVYIVIIRSKVQDYIYHRDVRRRAKLAWKLLSDAQRLTKEALGNG